MMGYGHIWLRLAWHGRHWLASDLLGVVLGGRGYWYNGCGYWRRGRGYRDVDVGGCGLGHRLGHHTRGARIHHGGGVGVHGWVEGGRVGTMVVVGVGRGTPSPRVGRGPSPVLPTSSMVAVVTTGPIWRTVASVTTASCDVITVQATASTL